MIMFMIMIMTMALSPHPLPLRPQASGLSPHPYEYDYDYGIIYHHVDILGGVAPPLGLKRFAVDTAVHFPKSPTLSPQPSPL